MASPDVLDRIPRARGAMVSSLRDLCRIPAVGPDNGGTGEGEKAEHVRGLLKGLGLKVERFDPRDDRVPGKKRPNLVVRGGKGPRLWVLCHLDVVPPGDASAWRCDPFAPTLVDGRLYGRGTEDNGQAIAALLGAYRAILDAGEEPSRPFGFAFVADEETGSGKGAKFLLESDVFGPKDVFLVPDRGASDGEEIEVAEKSLLWIRFTVRGRQAHASRPEMGVNALRAGAYLLTLLDANLPKRFPRSDGLFRPSTSTFEPTKKDANVPNVNTIPGDDVFYFDCRVLPSYATKEVLAAAQDLAGQAARTFGVRASVDVLQDESSPPTPVNAPVVLELTKVLQKVRGVRARPVGIGGGTVAAPLRRKGYPVAVWETTDQTAHGVDEYAKLDNLVGDAKVFAALLLGGA